MHVLESRGCDPGSMLQTSEPGMNLTHAAVLKVVRCVALDTRSPLVARAICENLHITRGATIR